MAEVKFTPDQQKVIDLRNRNILVSAAAGSGKTAVLVERIITMITDESNPVDVDRLLIVTFTNAAASEMRERILQAIEKKLELMPDNEHLQKQMMLIHSAQITTIHSFCLNVIRNHFNEIDLDPSFRIAEDAELTLLKADVLEDLLEEQYEKAEDGFTTFVESYASGKSDTSLEELVIQLFQFSMSYPWPEKFLKEQEKVFEISDIDELEQTELMKGLLQYIKNMTVDLLACSKQAMAIATSFQGPYMYEEALRSDEDILTKLLAAKTYNEYAAILEELKFQALSRKRGDSVNESKKESVKKIRDNIKKAIGEIKKYFFFQSEEAMLADIQAVAPVMKTLIELTLEFKSRYEKAKEEKNVVDFNDLEHFALNILVNEKDGVEVASSVAEELSDYFTEILIDEYQDSNLVQEKILNAISKQRQGNNNLFMVGDVKQSIYKFRLARPELFMDKYRTYTSFDSKEQRIDLHQNFRSREVVLAGINYIFEQIMTKQLGNIQYDDAAALYKGAVFEPTTENISESTEVIFVTDEAEADLEGESKDETNLENQDMEESEEEQEYSSREIEARAIGKRIKELTSRESGMKVWDKTLNAYVTARYSDIVILLRTMSGWSQVFADTLLAMGIPAYADTQSGYFSSIEIQTILNMLRVMDNPRQDIPLTAVLHSRLVGLSTDDLAIIRSHCMDKSMYDACMYFLTEISSPEKVLKDFNKLQQFFEQLNQYRECMAYTSIHELITRVITDTGYYSYVSALPAGDRRRANIDMLIERAVAYEETSYHGVFQFVRYIEKLHQYEVDFGEAVTVGESENTVRIMSIHKSKGLEFPIVFVAGMTKSFNNMDSRSKIVLHPEYGIGPDYIDIENRTKVPTLFKKYIQKSIVLENLGEELRVLYVALTRAKEKLILTGYVKSLEDCIHKWSQVLNQTSKELLFLTLTNASCYYDWIMPALVRHPDCEKLLENYNIKQMNILKPNQERDVQANFSFLKIDMVDLVEEEVIRQLSNQKKKERLFAIGQEETQNEALKTYVKETLMYKYPYINEVNLHAKVTVSELKKLSQSIEQEDSAMLLEEPVANEAEFTNDELLPAFMKTEAVVEGARRGTVYHKVLEKLSYSERSKYLTIDNIKVFINQLRSMEILSDREAEIVNPYDIKEFLQSNVACRIENAERNGNIYREQPFVYSVKANEIRHDLVSEEPILVQGIIDCFFEENGEIVLIDYKTDKLNELDGEDLLRERYKTQLDYYERAITQITGKRVKERLIYSFALKKEVAI